jgi:mRNA interferase RelE/StbE
MLESIRDRRVRQTILKRIDGLAEDPDKQGSPLIAELFGFRSVRAVGQRYRVIYRVERDRIVVLVVAVGLRREGAKGDVYELARKLFRLRLLGPESDEP